MQVDFLFRVLVFPINKDTTVEINVWVHEHSIDKNGKIYYPEEWVKNTMYDIDVRDEFNLADDKAYEVLGKGSLVGYTDIGGEYDEDINFFETTIKELPKEFYETMEQFDETIN